MSVGRGRTSLDQLRVLGPGRGEGRSFRKKIAGRSGGCQREMAPFDLSFDTWRALARIDFPFVTCRTRRSIHGSHDLFHNFMKIYSFHHMSHVSIDTCSCRDFSSFSRGPREHRCVASVDRTCAAHEPSHVAHVECGNRHVRGS